MSNNNSGNQSNSLLLGRKAPVTIIGVLLIGIAGSAFYDLLIKPGLNSISRFFFDIFTFGSQKVIDFSFSTAALDPTALPSLILLIILCSIAFLLPFRSLVKVLRRKIKSSISNNHPLKLQTKIALLTLLLILTTINVAIIFVPLNIYNQSVVTWRVFNANLSILSPSLDKKQITVFKSRFSSMKTEKDYREIEMEMHKLADEHQINLRHASPW